MKILLVTPHIFAGGAEKVVLHSAQKLQDLGCEVAVATLSLNLAGLPQELKNLRFITPKKQLPASELDGSRVTVQSMAEETFALFRLLRKHAADYDVLNPFNFPSYWATLFALTRRPVVWTCSEVLGPYRKTKSLYETSVFFRIAFNFSASVDRQIVKWGVDEIVTYSNQNRQLILEKYGLPSKVIPACVDFEFFSQRISHAKEQLGYPGNVILLHVGWLVPSKNHLVSIRALYKIKEKVPNAKLIIVGTGSFEPTLKQEVSRLGLGDSVVFTDATSQEQLRLLYQACDLNIYPVRNQTFGLVPFEVLAAGKPSIVSRECGAADLIETQKIGFLIEPDADELAKTVLYALEYPVLVEAMVERGRKYVSEYLTWTRYAQEMHAIFKNVLGTQRLTAEGKNPKS